MKYSFTIFISLVLCLSFSVGCTKPRKMVEVKPDGMTMLNNYVLDDLGSEQYDGYIGVKIKVGSSDLKVTMLGRIGKHMRNDHELTILDETKAVVASTKLTSNPDAYYKEIAYAEIVSEQDVILKADTNYYVLSKEEKGKDFWYGEKTSTSASPYFSIEGVVMSEDAYDFSFMKETVNKILGPVDFVFTIVEQEE